jgi:hypothetical protein
MAPSDDAGEIPAPMPAPSAPDMDEHRHSSASSSPPTHPAFFMASPVASPVTASAASPGKENVCPSTMAATYSPLASPLALNLGAKASQRPAADPGAVLTKFIDGCTSRSPRVQRHRHSLRDVDMSNTAAQPPHDVAPAADSNAGKKSKRKSKKTNGVKEKAEANAEDQSSSQPASYAEAVKEDPADVVSEEKGEADDETNQQNRVTDELVGDVSGPAANGVEAKNGDDRYAQPTAAGSLTFAEAVKEGPTDATTTNGQATEKAAPTESRSKDKSSASAPSYQGSPTVDYPDISSDAEGCGEEMERRRDQETAPEVAGLRWAPLRVPFKRRLQTLAVLFHCLCMGTTLSIFFGFCAIPLLWPLRTWSMTQSL